MAHEVKRRGRPVGSRLGSSDGPEATMVMPYLNFLKAHPVPEEPKGYSLPLFLKRFDVLTANVIENKPLVERLAEAAGMSTHVATRVMAGLTPVTANMIAAIAKKVGCSTDLLVTGIPHKRTNAEHDESQSVDESEVLAHYKKANPLGKASVFFVLTLQQLLDVIQEEGRSRVIGSLMRLHDAGAQEILAFLPSTLGAHKAKTGKPVGDCFDAPVVFTPVHEVCGVYGPETQPLMSYL